MASLLLRAASLLLTCAWHVTGQRCWFGCSGHGKWRSFWSGECECDALWEGECCNTPMCESIDNNLARDISLDEWVRATWYIQEQQITGYQGRESLFCVTATYNFENAQVPRFLPFAPPYWDGTVATVYNYANVDRVNGAPQNSDNMTLCARLQDPLATSKLSVAPCFLPNYFAGPYWILSVGENETGHYEWAIVIGGEPTEPYADGCSTKQSGINGAGLWLFSRVPVASEATIAAMRQELASKGITSQNLIRVQQEDCTYDGAFIKT